MTSWRSLVRWIQDRFGLRIEQRGPQATPRTGIGNEHRVTSAPPSQPIGREEQVVEDLPTKEEPQTEDGEAQSLEGGAPVEDRGQAARTQFAGHRTEPTDLVIGVDFGTLSTRVVVRSPFVGDGRAVPVRWRTRGKWPHFLPTALFANETGEFTLASDWETFDYGNLKTELMDRPKDLQTRARAAAYLGLVLRQARGYILETQADAYSQYRLRWTVHLGLPSAGYSDDPVKDVFLSVARAGWLLSLRTELPTLETATGALERAEDTEAIEADSDLTDVEVFPEIAALVVGYSRSRRRREGLHLMFDVGASTIDVCGFGLRNDEGDDEYLLYTALVERIGIRELHQRRIDAIESADLDCSLTVPVSLDPFSEVPSAGRCYLGGPTKALVKDLDQIDKRYEEDCTRAVMKVIKFLRRSRDPDSPAWRTGLTVFKAGGGAGHTLIFRALREADYRFTSLSTTKGIDVTPLPTLERLVDEISPGDDGDRAGGNDTHGGMPNDGNSEVSAALAGRLGVAYGLSFDRFEIGEITPPHEIADVPPKRVAQPVEYISKDQV